jgi:hypothetical protein
MKSRRIALCAALAAVISWAAKSVAIGVAGGLDKSPLEAPLFFIGLISFVVAVVALGIAVTPGVPTLMRIAAGVGAFVVGFAFTLIVDAVVGAFYSAGADRHWVWAEFNLWVSGLAAVAIAVALNRPRQPRTTLA